MTTRSDDIDETLPGFGALGLTEPLLASLTTLGYEEPTPIQRAAIPPLLDGKDLLGQAATGTGKTAAFALPLLQRIMRSDEGVRRVPATRALVLVPTRELAMQVTEAVRRYGEGLGASVLAVYGGASLALQAKALRGAHVVVATPGRALDHLRRKTLRLDDLEVLVLDEADEMLDMGFAEDLEAILSATPPARQTALFSATLPPRIVAIAGKHLRSPVRVTIARETVAAGAAPRVRQTAYVVMRQQKPAALGRILDMEEPTSTIVFCRTRTEVDEVAEALVARGRRAEALHGGLSQEQRDRVMKRFRSGQSALLVATDVAARGLDIDHVSHVVNYDVPSAGDSYVHRIGRTGRAGREGVAITLCEPREQRQLRSIESLTRQRVEVRTLPTLAELRTQRLVRVEAALRERVQAGGLAEARAIVESLVDELDVLDVAAAALRLAIEARGEPAEEEIRAPSPMSSRPIDARDRGRSDGKPVSRTTESRSTERASESRTSESRTTSARPTARPSATTRPTTATRTKGEAARPVRAGGVLNDTGMVRLFVGAGREQGIRPADLVGAIANEANIESRVIGAIQVGERYSLVEVPDEIADDIITALRDAKVKGKKVTVRRDRDNER